LKIMNGNIEQNNNISKVDDQGNPSK
jgi:hypothetical protein